MIETMGNATESAATSKVLTNRAIGIGAAIVLAVTLSSMVVLLNFFWQSGPKNVLDVIRTSASLGAGTGGAAALWLAARKQRATELDLRQKDHDATETRVTDLYGKAAEQLGSDKAPVRLAGIFALERLAQSHSAHRQTIVDLICAYLRMTIDPAAEEDEDSDLAQEMEVRRSAQGVLIAHLRRSDDTEAPIASFWPGIVLNLSGATLTTFTFTRCRVRSATFAGARFAGPASFRGTCFEDNADFRNARFTGLGDFRRVSFGGEGVTFRGTCFEGEVDFGRHTTAALSGALVSIDAEERRKWPAGWVDQPSSDLPGWANLIREERGTGHGTANAPAAS